MDIADPDAADSDDAVGQAMPAERQKSDSVESERREVAKALPAAATREDLVQALDLVATEKLAGAEVTDANHHRLRYSARGTVDEAYALHRKAFEANGWTLEPSVFQSDDATYKSLPMVKNGYYVDATFQQGNAATGEDTVYVTIENRGNIDPRDLPRPPKFKYPGGDRSAESYVALMELDEFSRFALETMTNAGWVHAEGLEFTQGALSLRFQATELGTGELSISITVTADGD